MAKIKQAGRSLTEAQIALGFTRYMAACVAKPTLYRHEWQKYQDFQQGRAVYGATCADTLIKYAMAKTNARGEFEVENDGIIVTF